MLFAKDFKTALAVVVATGLLGVGTAHATVLLSEDTPTGAAASNPVYFAAEAYPSTYAATPSREGGTPVSTTTLDHMLFVEHRAVDVALLPGDRYFVRFDLSGGAVFSSTFNGAPSLFRTNLPPGTGERRNAPDRVRGGRDGDDHGIWSFSVDEGDTGDDVTDTAAGDDSEVDVQIPAGEWHIDLAGLQNGGILLPRNQSTIAPETCYTIRMRLFDTLVAARNASQGGEAGDGDDRDGGIVDASGDLMCFTPTVSASVTAPKTLTASVAAGFRRFTGSTPASGTLATANVAVKTMKARGTRMLPIQDPSDGSNITAADVLKNVTFTLEGSFTHSQPFEFGEFKLGTATMGRYDADGDAITAAANKTAAGKAATKSVSGRVTAVGSYAFSVDVSGNTTAATSPYSQIGQGSYTAEWEIDQVDPGTGKQPAQDPASGEARAGSIERDGTTVRLGYLQAVTEYTNSENDVIGWNQRLVITNHSSIVAEATLAEYNAGDGVEVTCKEDTRWTCGDDEELTVDVDPNSQLVLKVADMIEIENGGRTAAMLTIAADASQISVATTHVTLPGGQTDTVRYWPLQ